MTRSCFLFTPQEASEVLPPLPVQEGAAGRSPHATACSPGPAVGPQTTSSSEGQPGRRGGSPGRFSIRSAGGRNFRIKVRCSGKDVSLPRALEGSAQLDSWTWADERSGVPRGGGTAGPWGCCPGWEPPGWICDAVMGPGDAGGSRANPDSQLEKGALGKRSRTRPPNHSEQLLPLG